MDSMEGCQNCMDLPIGQSCKACEIYELRQKIKELIVNNSNSNVDVCSGCVKIIITDPSRDRLICYCQRCYECYCDECYSKEFSKMISAQKEYVQICDKCWTM